MGGKETSRLLPHTAKYCKGLGVDFGCELDPHPNAMHLVDNQQIVFDRFRNEREVHIRNIDGGFSDWSDNHFDFAYSSHVIEHLVDPFAFVETCGRVVKPGGYVVIIGPHKDWYWPNGHPYANPDHKWWHLDQYIVGKWVEAYGMEVVAQHEFGRSVGNWSFMVVGKVKVE